MMMLGLWLSFIGTDPLGGVERFTFGLFDLKSGIPLLPMLIGVFAIPEIASRGHAQRNGQKAGRPHGRTADVHRVQPLLPYHLPLDSHRHRHRDHPGAGAGRGGDDGLFGGQERLGPPRDLWRGRAGRRRRRRGCQQRGQRPDDGAAADAGHSRRQCHRDPAGGVRRARPAPRPAAVRRTGCDCLCHPGGDGHSPT